MDGHSLWFMTISWSSCVLFRGIANCTHCTLCKYNLKGLTSQVRLVRIKNLYYFIRSLKIVDEWLYLRTDSFLMLIGIPFGHSPYLSCRNSLRRIRTGIQIAHSLIIRHTNNDSGTSCSDGIVLLHCILSYGQKMLDWCSAHERGIYCLAKN